MNFFCSLLSILLIASHVFAGKNEPLRPKTEALKIKSLLFHSDFDEPGVPSPFAAQFKTKWNASAGVLSGYQAEAGAHSKGHVASLIAGDLRMKQTYSEIRFKFGPGFTRFGFYQIGGLEEEEPYPRYHFELRAADGKTEMVFWHQPIDHDSEHAPEVAKAIAFDPEQWHVLSFEWVDGNVTYILDGEHEIRIKDPLFDYTRTGWKIWSHHAPLHLDRLSIWEGD